MNTFMRVAWQSVDGQRRWLVIKSKNGKGEVVAECRDVADADNIVAAMCREAQRLEATSRPTLIGVAQ